MSYGRKNPSGNARRFRIGFLRDRDGDACCRCGLTLDFSIRDRERPDFVTLEHFPIPWRECRSHEFEFLKLAHRFCNEHADLKAKIDAGNGLKRALSRFERNWHMRHPAAMQLLRPTESIEAAWLAHESKRAAA
jgi:hypothetical protein